MDIGVLELCGIAAALSAGLGGPIAIVKWCASFVESRVTEETKARIAAVQQLEAHISATIGHKVNNTASRVDAIERQRLADVERIVKLETNLTNLEKGQERIEHQLEKMESDSEKGRAEIIESLRELRSVSLKD